MEKDITNWKSLWKEEVATPIDLSALIKDLNSIEKKGKLERLVLLISILGTIILLVSFLPILSNRYYLTSVIIIGLGMLMILLQLFKSKQKLLNNESELNNQIYIKTLIDNLKQRMLITSKYMWFYTLMLILGINVGYIEVLQNFNMSIVTRIIIHAVITGIMLYIMHYAIEKRKKRNNKRILPLIELLKTLQ